MLRKALLGLVLTAGVAFAGEKGQVSKAQAPAAPVKLVSKKEVVREYVPVQRRSRLFLRQVGVSKSQTCTNCVDCPDCKK